MKLVLLLLIGTTTLLSAVQASAATRNYQLRLFYGSSNGSLGNVNDVLDADGAARLGAIAFGGAEATFTVLPMVEVGATFIIRPKVPRSTATSNESNQTEFEQYVLMGVTRFPFIQSSFFRFDLFAGAGASYGTLKIKKGSSNGELTQLNEKDFAPNFAARAGASVGVGYNDILVYVEAGIEHNKAGTLKKSGTIGSDIESIDMSGPYGAVGIYF